MIDSDKTVQLGGDSPMKANTRIFRREVTLMSEAQYEQTGQVLLLQRWRVVVDGDAGRWRKAERNQNGGWPKRMKAADIS